MSCGFIMGFRRVVSSSDIVARKQYDASKDLPPNFIIKSKAPSPQPSQVPDDYLTKVVKYIPAEIVAVFVTLDGVLKADATVPAFLYWLVFIALLTFVPLYTWKATKEKNLPPAYAQIVISTASFAIWVFALGGPFGFMDWYKPIYGSIALILFTLAPPLVLGK